MKLFRVMLSLLILSGASLYAVYPFTSIDDPGFHKLIDHVDNLITISVGRVILDLGGHTVTNTNGNGIIVNGGLEQITIKNGTVVGTTDAILVNPGCKEIVLENVIVKNATRGISFENVIDGSIRNCETLFTTTGIHIESSHHIVVDNCGAICNTHAGFCLVNTSTSLVRDCKSFSTGESNFNLIDQEIFGFVSTDGYANSFERCIANSTQALSTTDQHSIVAGFGLKGDEECTQIIDCESANAKTSPDGLTTPYGIWLESTLETTLTLTAVPSIPIPGDGVEAVAWSPDGKYLAVGTQDSGDTERIRIYAFDRKNNILMQVAAANPPPPEAVFSLDWSPDGNYLASANNTPDATGVIRIWEFDRANNTLNQVALPDQVPGRTGQWVRWSPDGRHVALGADDFQETFRLRVYEFDRVALTLTQVATPNIIPSDTLSVDWSPDGKYIAISTSGPSRIIIYDFNPANNTLIQVLEFTPDIVPVTSVWSPDGNYLAVGLNSPSIANRIRIFEFDRTNLTLTLVAVPDFDPGRVAESLDWTADGRYLAAGLSITFETIPIRIYEFDPVAQTLLQVATPDVIPGTTVNEVQWSPDGKYLAAGISSSDPNRVTIYDAFSMPSRNTIRGNTIYCNSGGSEPKGVGISGSSIQNLIVDNTAYSNPISQNEIEGGGPLVPTNYRYVTNVFNELFGQMPGELQNIALNGLQSVCTPDDTNLLVKQTRNKTCDMQTKIDFHTDLLISIIDLLTP